MEQKSKDDLIGCRRESDIQLLSVLNFEANDNNGYWMVCDMTNSEPFTSSFKSFSMILTVRVHKPCN